MQAASIVFIFISLISAQIVAQHPLIGTWEMVSVRGIDADGNPFFLDTTAAQEIKIITPTHYMLIAWDVDADSLIFNRTMGGRVLLEGEKYIELPMVASVQIFENVQADFKWKLEGDIFTQSGSIVRPDGKRVVLEALKFRRAARASNADNSGVGTWRQVGEYYTTDKGKETRTPSDTGSRLLIVTPTHWIRMDLHGEAFRGVAYGTYTIRGNRVVTSTKFSTDSGEGTESQFTQAIDGDKMDLTFSGTSPDGEAVTFHRQYEKQE